MREAVAWVLSLLLLAQLAGGIGMAQGRPLGTRTADLAALSAILGQPVALCAHGDPGAPDHGPAPCDHCTLCHVASVGLPPSVPAVPTPRPAILAAPRLDATLLLGPARQRGGFRPRDPPPLS